MKQLLLLLFLLPAWLLSAQDGIIRGSVIEDSNGEPIIGANILIQELATGTTTDLDGTFSVDVAPGIYTLQITYIGYQTLNIETVEVAAGQVALFENIRLAESSLELAEVVVTAKVIKTSEAALLTVKKNSAVMMDGVSSAKMKLTGDATAVEAAKRVTGVSVEGGKYVYVRGLGDRYSKTTLNNVEIPGLDPDRNTLQMDIFPTNLIDNIVVSKNFTADMPADFTGGLLNVETKDFPEEKIFNVSVSTSYNPQMNLNSDFLSYEGGATDFLGYDDGTRELPAAANQETIPTPIFFSDQEVSDFVRSFNPTLAVERQSSFLNFGAGLSLGNQVDLGKGDDSKSKLGYIFSISYKTDYNFYDEVINAEYQRFSDPDAFEIRYATIQDGEIGEKNILIGILGGLAYKTKLTKIRLTAMRLQNGESRAGKFDIINDGEAVGQSGYIANSDNLEYNERSLSNVLLNGTHVTGQSGWEIDWRISPTISVSTDPDIRKTALTYTPVDTFFSAGAAGNPSRIWRYLDETNIIGKVDLTKKYVFKGSDAKLKFGASHAFKERDYEILFFDIQFFANQSWPNPLDASLVLQDQYIYPNRPNSIYYQSGNNTPNPNAYSSNINNTGAYISNEFTPIRNLKTILGVRAENFTQRHTGRDQKFASGDSSGRNLDNEVVLDALDFFPSVNLIYALTESQNLRASYSRTIARPSFKELSFAQIIDPITNRIFNGSLFTYSDWDGNLSETRINNFDLRWEWFLEREQIFSISGFYKQFDNPIELVRIPEQQTSTEFQPRNVGDGQLYGVELEFRKELDFLSPALRNLSISSNVTLVESQIDMTDLEFNSRKGFERTGETIERTRQMAGQSPFVINAGITYSNTESGLDAGLFYNVKGSTLSIVGVGLYPDVFLDPFHSLNFSIIKRFGKDRNSTIDFKIANILNDKLESSFRSFEAENQLFSRLNPGISFGIGYGHKF
ncbi:MAG TPA: TonB-dependent receptor [Saprospiraceae bacterium]|nr:TonB-dependent receptor [Saprospiraceae bacterium]HMQ81349.1 TonB-dependent receptor [Saprospiraceae bacterium]